MLKSLLRCKLLCLVALLGFFIGVSVHVVAILQTANTVVAWATWLLGIGLFAVCGPMGSGVLRGGKWRGTVVHLSSVSLGHLEIVGHKEGAQGAEQR